MKRFNLEFKYGTSRGRDTYRYNLVTLYVDGQKVARECGGGYDMFGAALGQWISKAFQTELLAIKDRAHARYFLTQDGERAKPNEYREPRDGGLYGMAQVWRGDQCKISLDGSCGTSSMERILEALGYTLSRVTRDVYVVEPLLAEVAS